MRVLITGASSYIGREISHYLKNEGYEVVLLSRRGFVNWNLGEPIPNHAPTDILIHVAFDRKRTLSQNINDVKVIFSQFSGRSILLSSFSAHSKALSVYGRSKYGQERLFLERGDVVLKLGVVTGEGAEGIFMLLRKLVKNSKILPMPRKGEAKLRITPVESIVREVGHQISDFQPGIYNLTEPKIFSMKRLLESIASSMSLSRIFLPTNTSLLDKILTGIFRNRNKPSPFDSYLSILRDIDEVETSRLRIPLSLRGPE
jgi:nucleoside-diphosphate-sugar epimerase